MVTGFGLQHGLLSVIEGHNLWLKLGVLTSDSHVLTRTLCFNPLNFGTIGILGGKNLDNFYNFLSSSFFFFC